MCGRFALTTPMEVVADAFDVDAGRALSGPWEQRFNIAPTQNVPVVRVRENERQFEMMHWGLVPNWAKDPSIGSRMINARSETVLKKPAFASACERRRCIVPADGFFEWQVRDDGVKQPLYIQMADESVFGMAGLWEYWKPDDAEEGLVSCTILTTIPNEMMEPIHNRMPVILAPAEHDQWLDMDRSAEESVGLLDPFPADLMIATPVSRRVNNVANDDAACLTPEEPERGLFGEGG